MNCKWDRIDWEAAAGRGRMDLLIEYKGEKYIIEIKLNIYHSDVGKNNQKA